MIKKAKNKGLSYKISPFYVLVIIILFSFFTASFPKDNTVRAFGVAHRGLAALAPENTMPAFVAAWEAGFTYIEFDVQWTSDNIPVIIHDSTINRTARNQDGTTIDKPINVDSLSYEELLIYDFGLWKGRQFVGTKIPLFEEVISFCKDNNITPIIEIKDYSASQSDIISLINIVASYGLTTNAEWLATQESGQLLTLVKNELPNAILWYAVWKSIDEQAIITAKNLKTFGNRVVGVFPYSLQTEESINLLLKEAIPYVSGEPISTEAEILKLDNIVYAFFSEEILPEEVLY